MTDLVAPLSRSLFQLAMLRMRRNLAAMASLVIFGLIVRMDAGRKGWTSATPSDGSGGSASTAAGAP